MAFSLNYAVIVMIVTLGVFAAIMALLPGQLIANQLDYVSPTTQSQEVVSYFSANNITVYKNTWDFYINFGSMQYNQSGLADGHRLEFFWVEVAPTFFSNPCIYVKHAYPSPLGAWWLWSNPMVPLPKYRSIAGPFTGPLDRPGGYMNAEPFLLTKTNILNLKTSSNSSYFECSDGGVTANFVVMNGNTTTFSDLSHSWDGQKLHVLSSFEVDFEAMKPNAWWLIAQMVTFQAPNLGIPGAFGELLTYIFGLGFWVVVALIIYTVATRLIPTIRGGVEG
jgi:hypothetical protein